MTTMGLRGVLACAFIVSSSLLTGLVALPSGAAASERPSALAGVPAVDQPGVLDRVKRKACLVSLAATRTDRGASPDRSRACGE